MATNFIIIKLEFNSINNSKNSNASVIIIEKQNRPTVAFIFGLVAEKFLELGKSTRKTVETAKKVD